MTDIVTGRMTPVGLEACVAYGAAALAVMEVKHAAATADVTKEPWPEPSRILSAA